MLHSTPISEPAALISSLVSGLFVYGILAGLGASHDTSFWVASFVSTLFNFGTGGPINLAAADILAFFLVRPISPIVGAKVLAYMVS